MQKWTDAYLDEMRRTGDPIADAAMTELCDHDQVGVVSDLMMTLIRNEEMPSAKLPLIIQRYLQETREVPASALATIERGEEFFGEYGPETLWCLGMYSMPTGYAVRRMVDVLDRTGALRDRPMRRLFETMQFVVDVMKPGGLQAGGDGVRTAQKVRLMHAAIRHLITHDARVPWPKDLGMPISQEDLAGTLMGFSYLVLDGLASLGIEVPDQDQEAYLAAWRAVGVILGIQPGLLPESVAEARELTETLLLHRPNIDVVEDGQVLTRALIAGMATLLPGHLLARLPACMIRHFLSTGMLRGLGLADRLGVPPPDWTQALVRASLRFCHLLGWIDRRSARAASLSRLAGSHLVSGLLYIECQGKRPQFRIPTELQDRWGVPPGADAASVAPQRAA